MNLPSLNQLKAIIFDVGGVMLRTHDHRFRHAWDIKLEQKPGFVEHLVFNSDLGTAAQTGQVTTAAHWQAIGQRLKLNKEELAALRQDFWAGDRFDFDMIAWIRSWHGRYKTAIISNAFDDLRSVLTNEFEVADAFDLIVVSAEEGLMKPDPIIYQRTLARLDCTADEAVFIDDSPVNVAGAQAIGLAAILYRPGVDLKGHLPVSPSTADK